jgi:hypothetical protein
MPQRLLGIETGGFGRPRNKALQIFKRSDLGRDRRFGPARHFGPDKKWCADGEAPGHADRTVGCHARECGTAVGDRHFAAQLFERAEPIDMSAVGEGVQVECGCEFSRS